MAGIGFRWAPWKLATGLCLVLLATGAASNCGDDGGAKSMPEVMKRMQYYNKSLGVDCDYCHVPAKFEIDTPRKRTAKWMQTNLVEGLVTREGQTPIDCHTCHDGRARFLPSSQ